MVDLVCLLMQDAKGNDVDLSVYKGKVLLIVNVASKWYSPHQRRFSHLLFLSSIVHCCFLFVLICCSGLTNANYTELNQLYQQYKDQGFEQV